MPCHPSDISPVALCGPLLCFAKINLVFRSASQIISCKMNPLNRSLHQFIQIKILYKSVFQSECWAPEPAIVRMSPCPHNLNTIVGFSLLCFAILHSSSCVSLYIAPVQNFYKNTILLADSRIASRIPFNDNIQRGNIGRNDKIKSPFEHMQSALSALLYSAQAYMHLHEEEGGPGQKGSCDTLILDPQQMLIGVCCQYC